MKRLVRSASFFIQLFRNYGSQGDGVYLCFKGIGTAGKDGGNLGSCKDASVLYAINHVHNCFVNQVSCMDVGEQQNVRIPLDFAVGCPFVFCSLRLRAFSG